MASAPNDLPDPFEPDPSQSSPEGDTTPTPMADGPAAAPSAVSGSATTQAPSGLDPSPAVAGGEDTPDPTADSASPALMPPSGSDGTLAPQHGFWVDNRDPQFLIQWSLDPAQDAQLASTSSPQTASPGYKAQVRIFQSVFETTLAATRPVVPFSLRDGVDPYPYLQGSLVLLAQPSAPPVLLVKNLKFPGFQQTQVVLYPSSTPATPDLGGRGPSSD